MGGDRSGFRGRPDVAVAHRACRIAGKRLGGTPGDAFVSSSSGNKASDQVADI